MNTERFLLLKEIKDKLDERLEYLQTNTIIPPTELQSRVFENNLMAVYINQLLLDEISAKKLEKQKNNTYICKQ